MKYLFLSIFLSLVCVNLYSQDFSKEDESTDNIRLEISDDEDNKVYSISKNEFSRLNIIKLLVGGFFDTEDGYQKWMAPKQTLIPLDAEDFAYTVVDTIFPIEISDIKFKLVVTKSSQKYAWGGFDEGVESLPCIGMALFSENNDQWVLESFNPAVTLFGEQNMIPEMRICNVGPAKKAIIFHNAREIEEEKWFLLEQYFPIFLEYYYAYPVGENLEKYIYTKVEPIEVNNEDAGEFFDLKVTQYEETYDEKTDKSKQKILETKILTPSFENFNLKFPFTEK